MRSLLLLLSMCASLYAQLDLFLLGAPGVETPAGTRLDFSSVTAGDFADMRLRLRNATNRPETLKNVAASGTGFSVENLVPLPYSVPAGLNVDFRLRFRPTGSGSFSGSLRVNDKTWLVTGRSPEAASLFLDDGGAPTPVTNAIPVDFGRIERGTRSWRRFILRNLSGVRVTVRSVAVEAGVFSIPNSPRLPLELADNGETTFEVLYSPVRSGVQRANLEIDGRTFILEGMAIEPPFPEAHLTFLGGSAVSGEQLKLGITLASPSRAIGSGTLTLSFTPAPGLPDDAAVQFVASSSRTLRVTVREGDVDLLVNGMKEIAVQTGTTAGQLSVGFDLDGQRLRLTRDIAPMGVRASSVTAGRTSSGVQLQVTGFDNTRTVSTIGFYFYDTNGALIGGAPVTADAANVFRQYFGASNLGGVFLMSVQFPVQGDTARIGGVEIEFANAAGRSRTTRASFASGF
jgi:hypothetical protein